MRSVFFGIMGGYGGFELACWILDGDLSTVYHRLMAALFAGIAGIAVFFLDAFIITEF